MVRISNPKDIQKLINSGRIKASSIVFAKQSLKATKKIEEENSSEEILFKLLKSHFGDYFEDDGEVVKELIPLSNRKFRADTALVYSKIIVEADGVCHAITKSNDLNLRRFKNDRERDLILTANGWLVIRAMRDHIIKKPYLIIDAVKKLMSERDKVPTVVKKQPNGICFICHSKEQ
jgi:hypothetical protein